MAVTKTFKKVGFGQVEPNHLSAQRTSQIYAQLPAKDNINTLENGQFVKYDTFAGEVNFDGEGEWMMVFNEVKLYDDYRETYADFAMKKDNYTDGIMVPRVIKTNPGDIFTTNMVKDEEITEGDKMIVDTNGVLKVTDASVATEPMVWQVAKITTMPDGKDAVKLRRIK